MICPPCNEQKHTECTNPDTCPCQHRKTVHMADGTVSPQSERGALRMVEDATHVLTMQDTDEGFRVAIEEVPIGSTVDRRRARMGRIK